MEGLPPGVLGHALGFLPLRQVCRARETCKAWSTARAFAPYADLSYEYPEARAMALRVLEPHQVRDLLLSWTSSSWASSDPCSFLRSFSQLQKLVLLSAVPVSWLSALASCCPNLTSLELKAGVDNVESLEGSCLDPSLFAGLRHLELGGEVGDTDLDLLPDTLESLRLSDCSRLTWLGGLARFRRLSLLSLSGWVPNDLAFLVQLSASLRSLSLEVELLEDADLRAIGTCFALETLHLQVFDPSEWTLAGISSLGRLKLLRDFKLDTDYGEDLGAIADMLLAALVEGKVDTLCLQGLIPTRQGVKQNLDKMPLLRRLVIAEWPDDCVEAVVSACPLLRSLELMWVVGESAVGSPFERLPLLRSLTLGKFSFVWGLGSLPSLETLRLDHGDATDVLLFAGGLPRLRELGMGVQVYGFNDECAGCVGRLSCLEVLRVESCPELSDHGLALLPRSLKALRLGSCGKISDQGLPWLPLLLTSLGLVGSCVSAHGFRGLWSRLQSLEKLER